MILKILVFGLIFSRTLPMLSSIVFALDFAFVVNVGWKIAILSKFYGPTNDMVSSISYGRRRLSGPHMVNAFLPKDCRMGF